MGGRCQHDCCRLPQWSTQVCTLLQPLTAKGLSDHQVGQREGQQTEQGTQGCNRGARCGCSAGRARSGSARTSYLLVNAGRGARELCRFVLPPGHRRTARCLCVLQPPCVLGLCCDAAAPCRHWPHNPSLGHHWRRSRHVAATAHVSSYTADAQVEEPKAYHWRRSI
jgi:hypothetical protein